MAHAHRFFAHAETEGRSRLHRVEADTALDAAVGFAEHWLPVHPAAGEVRVIVEDRETGRSECYLIDLADFDVEPCPPAET